MRRAPPSYKAVSERAMRGMPISKVTVLSDGTFYCSAPLSSSERGAIQIPHCDCDCDCDYYILVRYCGMPFGCIGGRYTFLNGTFFAFVRTSAQLAY